MGIASTLEIAFFLYISTFSDGKGTTSAEQDSGQGYCLTRFMLLPPELSENSGITGFDTLVWTINDSGGNPCIFGLDTTTGEIVKRIWLDGTENKDWEEITQDEAWVYIGDFGNNDGSRNDLRILKIRKSDLKDTVVTPLVMDFRFADQYDFTPALYQTPFDCEAMISAGDTLYLFTKNWTGGASRIYKLPSSPGDHVAILCDSLMTEGLVTAASYSASGHRLFLLGYKDYIPFLCMLDGFTPGRSYNGTLQTVYFTDYFGLQTEGIVLTRGGDILVSCERGYHEPYLFKVTHCK
jgi:hypothetical protein